MKNLNKWLLFFLLCALVSCGKKEIGTEVNSKLDPLAVEIMLLGPWKITSYVTGSGVDYFNTQMPACEKDNVIRYINGYVSVDDGTLKCSPNTPQIVTEKILIGEETIRTFAGNNSSALETFEVVLLNETTLKLKSKLNNSIITYTKQAIVVIVSPIAGKWKMTGFIQKGYNIWNNSYTVGNITYNKIGDCLKDDITIFINEGLIIQDEGALKCDFSDPQISNGFYTLTPDIKTLTTTLRGFTVTNEIILINETTLKLNSDGNIITYTKQP